VDYFRAIFSKTHNGQTIVGIGDDCALFDAAKTVTSAAVSNSDAKNEDSRVLVSTDMLVEDVHFRSNWITAKQLAQRAFAQNVADIASCGGRPTGLVVSIAVPSGRFAHNKDADIVDSEIPTFSTPTFSMRWVVDFATSLAEICTKNDVAVLGGDLTYSEQIVINITIFGTLESRRFCARNGAQVGDTVALAGLQGFSRAGMQKLMEGNVDDDSIEIQQFLVPNPPLEAGVRAVQVGTTAMMDVSDGLAKDASRLAKLNGVTFELNAPETAYAEVGLENFYLGGEDHSMLATFPPTCAIPAEFVPIGRVLEFTGEYLVGNDIAQVKGGQMWDHFGEEYV
jgi:thiamine-monophosphate kinase